MNFFFFIISTPCSLFQIYTLVLRYFSFLHFHHSTTLWFHSFPFFGIINRWRTKTNNPGKRTNKQTNKICQPNDSTNLFCFSVFCFAVKKCQTVEKYFVVREPETTNNTTMYNKRSKRQIFVFGDFNSPSNRNKCLMRTSSFASAIKYLSSANLSFSLTLTTSHPAIHPILLSKSEFLHPLESVKKFQKMGIFGEGIYLAKNNLV